LIVATVNYSSWFFRTAHPVKQFRDERQLFNSIVTSAYRLGRIMGKTVPQEYHRVPGI
jgi:hypothetical protein